MTNAVIDQATVYLFVSKLVTPFVKWPAYQRGIIDAQGNVLKKRADLVDPQDKNAWGYMDILAANLKKIIAKAPGGTSQMASVGAAVLLLREQPDEYDTVMLARRYTTLLEDAAVNAVGGGNLAGTGVGPDGEPGVKPGKRIKIIRRNQKDAAKQTTSNAA